MCTSVWVTTILPEQLWSLYLQDGKDISIWVSRCSCLDVGPHEVSYIITSNGREPEFVKLVVVTAVFHNVKYVESIIRQTCHHINCKPRPQIVATNLDFVHWKEKPENKVEYRVFQLRFENENCLCLKMGAQYSFLLSLNFEAYLEFFDWYTRYTMYLVS